MARIYMARSGHVNEMARPGEEPRAPRHSVLVMHATYVNGITIRPLRNGDAATVLALFGRLGERARASRFCGAKPRLTDAELACLARVDARPARARRLRRRRPSAGGDREARPGRRCAEIALSVADDSVAVGAGTVLLEALASRRPRRRDHVRSLPRCAGQSVDARDPAKALGLLDVRWQWGEREITVPLGV